MTGTGLAEHWTTRSACGPDDAEDDGAVRRLCRRCPVRADCLDAALENDERYGIWGGFTPEERARFRKDPRPAAEVIEAVRLKEYRAAAGERAGRKRT